MLYMTYRNVFFMRFFACFVYANFLYYMSDDSRLSM